MEGRETLIASRSRIAVHFLPVCEEGSHGVSRDFLRCMQGYGLCALRLGCFDEARMIFERMLWLNPSDNQGIRFLVDDVKDSKKRESVHGDGIHPSAGPLFPPYCWFDMSKALF